ncbi:MAG: ABC transporter substrate-binding protein [Nitrospinota bacterium]
MKRGLTVFATILLLMSGLAARADAAKTTFLLDWIIYGKHAPFFVAQDKGFYKKVGLDVVYKRGFGSGRTIKDIAAKIAPIGFADAASLVNARANSDIKIKEVAMIHAKTIMVATFFKEKGYKSPKDLAGARIGSPVGNAVRVVFPAFAAANGLDPKSVKWVDVANPGSVLPTLLAGRSDVALFYATELPTVRPAAAKIGKEIEYFSYGDWGVRFYNNGIIAREETIQSNPNFVRNAVKANMEAFAWSLLHVDEAVKNFLKYAPAMSEPIIRGHFAVMVEHLFDDGVRRHGLGYMDHAKMDSTIETLTKLQKLKKRIPTGDLYTNRFLPQWPAIKAALGDKAM